MDWPPAETRQSTSLFEIHPCRSSCVGWGVIVLQANTVRSRNGRGGDCVCVECVCVFHHGLLALCSASRNVNTVHVQLRSRMIVVVVQSNAAAIGEDGS